MQTWLHALDLEKLIKEHTEYLHGNSYKNRKLALNQAIRERIMTLIIEPFQNVLDESNPQESCFPAHITIYREFLC